MEGVPRLPMLRSVLKTTPEKTDFSRKIKWVRHFLKGYYRLTRMSDIIRDDSSLIPDSKSENTSTKTPTAT